MHSPGRSALFLRTFAPMALAMGSGAFAQGIYTCVDAKGNRLTSDRPLLECLDREQRELNANGTLRRTLPPSYTADERAAIEEKTRREQEQTHRENEERLRIRALRLRYPDAAALVRDQAATLSRSDDLIATARRRITELQTERRKLDDEAAFYAGQPQRMPPTLRRALDENARLAKAQAAYVTEQVRGRERAAESFDEIARQLRGAWAENGSTATR